MVQFSVDILQSNPELQPWLDKNEGNVEHTIKNIKGMISSKYDSKFVKITLGSL